MVMEKHRKNESGLLDELLISFEAMKVAIDFIVVDYKHQVDSSTKFLLKTDHW